MPRTAGDDKIRGQGPPVWEFELQMHPAQAEIYEHPARFKVVAAGRRFGKTMLGMTMAIVKAADGENRVVEWVAPTHDQSRKVLREFCRLVPPDLREVNKTMGEVYLPNGSIVLFRSGERFDNLRGEGLDLVVVDEAAFVPREAWYQALRPALADKLGTALLISTFNGENWFYDLWRRAVDPENAEWHGWRIPTSANPYILASEIEEARRNLPADEFGQEFEASPLTFVGSVFPGDRLERAWELAKGYTVAIPLAGSPMLPPLLEAGLDWGHNVTAFEVAHETPDGRIIWVHEAIYERIELRKRCMDIARLCNEFRIQTIYADAAGASENVTLAAVLAEEKTPTVVQPVPFNAYKRAGIVTRGYYLEREREMIGPECVQLLIDSKAYHYERDSEKPAKGSDHTVDAATAFYASRSAALGDTELASLVEHMGEAA